MPRYRVAGVVFELPWAIEWPEVSEAAHVRVELGPAEPIPAVESAPGFRISREADGLEISIGSVCRFRVRDDGLVTCVPDPAADEREVQRQVLEHLIPRLLSRGAGLVLHASSVVVRHAAVAFVARSGQGKSTLALALARAGLSVLSDDCLIVEPDARGPLAHPLWATLRVHADDLPAAIRERAEAPIYGKSALREGDEPTLSFSRQPRPLARLYVLEQASEIEITRLSPPEALMALMRGTYHLEYDDLNGLERLMARIEQLGLLERTYRLAYPREFGRLEEVCARVADHALEAERGMVEPS